MTIYRSKSVRRWWHWPAAALKGLALLLIIILTASAASGVILILMYA